eukprot:CAMPEP_0114303716 /NCGR_PEP_ID=MMETSP0059-20121206/15376_1 /TAXON_ID=36894 /ORGANISM="Pyramimonas parkeae, Strain CCMP726" /LENGTH=185 /DNA_ID=CAMNT_0001426715 /DNA_START=52 /DNA_END=609 /DNA_ORIENTATION=-
MALTMRLNAPTMIAKMSAAKSRANAPGFIRSAVRKTDLTLAVPARRHNGTRAVSTKAVTREVISTDKAPAAVGPYSQGIKVGNTIYVSGCIGLVPETMKFVDETVAGQTKQVMDNMGEILKAAGATYGDVVKTTILLAEISDFGVVNPIYAEYFKDAPPARATFAVKDLPLGARVEIDCTAVIDV